MAFLINLLATISFAILGGWALGYLISKFFGPQSGGEALVFFLYAAAVSAAVMLIASLPLIWGVDLFPFILNIEVQSK